MSNEIYFDRIATRQGAAQLYEAVANDILELGADEGITPVHICIIAGFDPTASQEAAGMVPLVSEKMKKGVDRYFEANDQLIGFARQIHKDKEMGVNFLVQGKEFLMDRRMHQLSLLLRAQTNFSNDTRDIVGTHLPLFNNKEKKVFLLLLGMAEDSIKDLNALTTRVIPRLVSRDEAFEPLENLMAMLITAEESMRA
jgi:hypothetical protein